MLLYVNKDNIDGLNLGVDVATYFVAGNDDRKHVFDTEFNPSDQL